MLAWLYQGCRHQLGCNCNGILGAVVVAKRCWQLSGALSDSPGNQIKPQSNRIMVVRGIPPLMTGILIMSFFLTPFIGLMILVESGHLDKVFSANCEGFPNAETTWWRLGLIHPVRNTPWILSNLSNKPKWHFQKSQRYSLQSVLVKFAAKEFRAFLGLGRFCKEFGIPGINEFYNINSWLQSPVCKYNCRWNNQDQWIFASNSGKEKWINGWCFLHFILFAMQKETFKRWWKFWWVLSSCFFRPCGRHISQTSRWSRLLRARLLKHCGWC